MVTAAQTGLGTTTPNVAVQNPPAADMMRAYAALGLSYPNQQAQQNIRPHMSTASGKENTESEQNEPLFRKRTETLLFDITDIFGYC